MFVEVTVDVLPALVELDTLEELLELTELVELTFAAPAVLTVFGSSILSLHAQSASAKTATRYL